MTLQQLLYVVALDDHRQFVKAAEACDVTQPTLTMQVRKLEEELEVVLFDRRAHPVRPTAIGTQVIARARVVLREAGQLEALVTELHAGLSARSGSASFPPWPPTSCPSSSQSSPSGIPRWTWWWTSGRPAGS